MDKWLGPERWQNYQNKFEWTVTPSERRAIEWSKTDGPAIVNASLQDKTRKEIQKQRYNALFLVDRADHNLVKEDTLEKAIEMVGRGRREPNIDRSSLVKKEAAIVNGTGTHKDADYRLNRGLPLVMKDVVKNGELRKGQTQSEDREEEMEKAARNLFKESKDKCEYR